MNHDELLAEIKSLNDSCSISSRLGNALKAVVELHKCSNPRFDLLCDCGRPYPCPTIQAIEKELK